ncbi:MAG: hypothetical protein IKX14_05150, partial [Neisseriaceae bacterium]|nr:hypothetical protein [Neisseriaceae bacterium]
YRVGFQPTKRHDSGGVTGLLEKFSGSLKNKKRLSKRQAVLFFYLNHRAAITASPMSEHDTIFAPFSAMSAVR